MIILVSEYLDYYTKTLNLKLYNDIRVVNNKEGLEIFRNKVKGKRKVCLDVEANGLDPYVNKVLGLGIKVSNFKFIFDNTNDYSTVLALLKKKMVIGQNLKYDMKMLHINGKVGFTKIYDTLIAEQRLFMGTKDRKGLDSLINKYCNKLVLKDTRNTFIGANANSFRFTIAQIKYLVGDLDYLEEIRNKQRKFITQYSMEFLLNGIEFPLLESVANAELEGFVLDKELWIENVKAEEENNFNILCKLDAIFLKIKHGSNHNKGYFKSIVSSSRFSNKRIKPDIFGNINKNKQFIQEDLFGEFTASSIKTKAKVYENNIKWNSPKEIQLIAGALGVRLPTEYDSEIPPIGANTFNLIKPVSTFKLGKGRLVEYLEEFDIPPLERELLQTIQEFNASVTNLGTFGRSFLEKINPITGKIHTIFRTCTANTGRFQSGGGRNDPDKYNAQNIPAKKAYRIPFSANKEHYDILTADYSGAELIVMASHAQDFRLIELSKGDMHTHMGNKMYRAIYKARAWNTFNTYNENKGAYTTKQLYHLNETYKFQVKSAKEYEINPETERKGCKPMTFGVIYGMYGKKAEKTMGLHKGEGNIVIEAIKSEIPKTIKMVENASTFAERNGYVIHNKRTNSRRWFPVLVDVLNNKLDKFTNFGIVSKELSEARNTRIQGTQADFVKEATVVLNKHINKVKLKTPHLPHILSWVHDEFVIAIPKETVFTEPYYYEGTEFNNLVDLIKDLLVRVANRYLSNVEISADVKIEPTWIK